METKEEAEAKKKEEAEEKKRLMWSSG